MNRHLWTMLAASAACSLLVGCATGSYIGYRISPDYPKDKNSEIAVPGLHNEVKVYLDAAGVPHIDALDEEDLLRAVGFVQGRNRFFEMDILRRLARGRLSELVGEQPVLDSTTVLYDLSMRGWGFDRASEMDAAALDPATRRLIQAYVDGINRALELYGPLEYRLLRVKPEPWTIADSFAVGRLNAWSVTHNWHQEASRLLFALHGGIERSEKIYPSDWWHGGVSMAGTDFTRPLPPAVAPELRPLFPPREPSKATETKRLHGSAAAVQAAMEAASNSWVLAGNLTSSKKPVLANDPHMTHLLPSIMFQEHLRAPGLDVIGATVPGLPYVLAGHNRDVAWGMTSTVGDCIDLYIEKINPFNADEYESPTGLKRFEKDILVISVREGERMTERSYIVRRSMHGPVMNDMYPGMFPDWAPPIAIRWESGSAAGSIAAIGRANRAKNVTELRRELLGMVTPVSTWTAADSGGNIAIFINGTLPVRKNHLGTFPVPGWLAAYDWSGNVPPEDMPYALSKEGFFAHGNNLMQEPDRSAVFVNVDSAPSYRFDRISELIQARGDHTWESMSAVQKDVVLLRAKRIVPVMAGEIGSAPDLSPVEREAVQILKDWDLAATVQSPAPVVFFLTYREAVIEALKDELDARGLEFILSQRYSTNVADLWFDSSTHPVWDNRLTPGVEKRKDALLAAFRRAMVQAAAAQGPDPSAWRWGKLHDMHFKHLFGGQKALASFVNLPQSEAAGALDSIWKSHFDMGHPSTPFRATAGPAYRMVADLSDLGHSRWIVDTGASGWAGSPHYGDQHPLWKNGELLPMVSNWDEIATSSKAVLTLK